jgi:hypothetical protein
MNRKISSSIEVHLSEEEDLRRASLRRKMRGIATFFIIISIIGVLGALVVLGAGERGGSSDELWGQIVVVFGMLFAAIGAWHGSRVTAFFLVLLLLVSPLSAIMGYAELGKVDWLRSGLYITLSIVMLLSAARYHAVMRSASQTVGGAPWVRWVGKVLSGAVIAVCAIGVLVLSVSPSTMLIKGAEISDSQSVWLSENGFLEDGERPIYLYFDGLFSHEEGGALLTNKYVGSWWQEENELQAYWIELGQVCDVKTINEGSFTSDAVYQVHGPGEDHWVQVWLSTENNLHRDFISRMKTINDRKMRSEIQHFAMKIVP